LELNENVLRRWKKELRLHAEMAFLGNGNYRALNREADLERKIGQMTLEIDFLKKALRQVEEHRLLENAVGSSRSLKRSNKR
jgi:transposase-like protein